MPSDRSARQNAGDTVQCSRINLSEASKLPSQDAGSPAWPFRSRKQQLDGLLFSPRELCTSPDEFTDVVQASYPTEAKRGRLSQLDLQSDAADQLPAVLTKPGYATVSHVNLPQSVPTKTSPGDVSYCRDAHSEHLKLLDLSNVQRCGQEPAIHSSKHASRSARLPLVPNTTSIPDWHTVSKSATTSRTDTRLSKAALASTAAAATDLQSSQHAEQASLVLPIFKMPTAFGGPSPLQASRLEGQPKAWQVYSTAGTAREPASPTSNSLAAKAWQQALAGSSAHEQWVMRRHLTHARMSEAGSEDGWGEISIRLPKQATENSNAEQLLQQLPDGLNGAAELVKLTKDDQGNAQLSILMGGKPSGRSQTLLLASWLRDQIAECSSPVQMSGEMQSKPRLLDQTLEPVTTLPGVSITQTQSLGAAADAAADRGQMSQGKRRSADVTALPALATQPSLGLSARQVSPKQAALGPSPHSISGATPRSPVLNKPAWASSAGSPRRLGLASQSLALIPQPASLPDAPPHASIPNWQGLLAEEAGSLGLPFWADDIIRHHPGRAGSVLSLLGTAFGVLVHQVSMHCFERGAVMAGLWNLFTALMDAEVQSLEEHAQELLTGQVLSPGGSLTSKQLQRMVTALDLASDKGAEISALEAHLLHAKSKALLYETVSHELEEEALRREREAEQHLKGLQAAAAAKEGKQVDELKAKEQQISDLQAELLEQSNLISKLASKLEIVTTDVHGLGRFVTQQLVPASPEVEHKTQDGSRYICVGLDALSAADELVEGVSLDLQQVIGKMRQATHTKYAPSVDFGANKVAVLHTLIQPESMKEAEVAAPNVMQVVQNYTAAAAAAKLQPAWMPKQLSADQAAQTVTIVIKVDEPIYLTLQAGEADGYEQEIADLRAELVKVERHMEDSYAQLADKGGALEAAQAMLAEAHDALTKERQMTASLKEKIRTNSGVPLLLATSGSNAVAAMIGGEGASVARTLSGAADKTKDGAVHDTKDGAVHDTKDGAVHDTKDGADPSADPAAASPNVGSSYNRTFRETQSTARLAGRGESLSRLKSMSNTSILQSNKSITTTLAQEMRSSSPLPVGKVKQLQEAMTAYPDIKPRSMEWCLKLVDALFKSKRVKDAECDRANVPRALFMDHVFAHLLMTYGAKNMVTEFAACLMVTARRLKAFDLRLEMFERFATSEWDLRILSGFLAADQLLGEPTRVVCCDYPAGHSPVRYGSPWVCIHKCIFVADMVLGKRSAATTRAFAAQLVARAEPAEEQEVQKYFVDPQSTSERESESEALAKSLMKSGMKKMSAIHFKQALCMELLRCESIVKDTLPSIIKEFDLDDSGGISQVELSDVLAMFEGPSRDPVMLKKECEKVWKEAQQLSMAEASQASVSGERHSGDALSSEVDIRAAAKACRNSEVPRRFIRLHYTPPLPTDESAEEEADMAKMMFMIVKRQWRQHQHCLTRLFAVCGHKENYLKDLATRFVEEGNHQRKVQLFFTITLTLLEHQLLNLKQKCSPAALAADPKMDVEAMFSRIVNAIKVLYGHNCLLQDDFTASEIRAASPSGGVVLGKARRLKQDQMSIYNAVQAKFEQYAAQLIGQKYVTGIQRWRKQAEMALSLKHKV
ncbi:TPA: hypothetical protein ACH3X1_009695 [Trebouxia sp. C0004]